MVNDGRRKFVLHPLQWIVLVHRALPAATQELVANDHKKPGFLSGLLTDLMEFSLCNVEGLLCQIASVFLVAAETQRKMASGAVVLLDELLKCLRTNRR